MPEFTVEIVLQLAHVVGPFKKNPAAKLHPHPITLRLKTFLLGTQFARQPVVFTLRFDQRVQLNPSNRYLLVVVLIVLLQLVVFPHNDASFAGQATQFPWLSLKNPLAH